MPSGLQHCPRPLRVFSLPWVKELSQRCSGIIGMKFGKFRWQNCGFLYLFPLPAKPLGHIQLQSLQQCLQGCRVMRHHQPAARHHGGWSPDSPTTAALIHMILGTFIQPCSEQNQKQRGGNEEEIIKELPVRCRNAWWRCGEHFQRQSFFSPPFWTDPLWI